MTDLYSHVTTGLDRRLRGAVRFGKLGVRPAGSSNAEARLTQSPRAATR
jgi:hypothetical protein